MSILGIWCLSFSIYDYRSKLILHIRRLDIILFILQLFHNKYTGAYGYNYYYLLFFYK